MWWKVLEHARHVSAVVWNLDIQWTCCLSVHIQHRHLNLCNKAILLRQLACTGNLFVGYSGIIFLPFYPHKRTGRLLSHLLARSLKKKRRRCIKRFFSEEHLMVNLRPFSWLFLLIKVNNGCLNATRTTRRTITQEWKIKHANMHINIKYAIKPALHIKPTNQTKRDGEMIQSLKITWK